MQWLFPIFLAGAGAVALPILLHLFRRRPRQQIEFPSLRFLQVARQQSDTSQRLRRLIILLLRCAAIALLAGAFARPFFPKTQSFTGRTTVLVIDNSFSMRAANRWSTLLSWAEEQLSGLRPGDRLGILVTAPVPTWLAPISDRTGETLGKFVELRPSFYTSRNEPALRLAADVLAFSPARERRLVFVGDHQAVSWAGTQFSKPLPSGIEAIFSPAPKPLARQAALGRPALTAQGGELEGSVVIRNYTGAQNRILRIFREGELKPLVEKSVSLAANETRNEAFHFALPKSERQTIGFRFTLDADELAADDEVYWVWNPSAQRRVLLDAPAEGSTTDFLSTALNATASMDSGFAPEAVPSQAWPTGVVAVLRHQDSFTGAHSERLLNFLQQGGSALIFLNGSTAQEQWLAKHAQLQVRPIEAGREPQTAHAWALDHPLVMGLANHDVRALLDWNFQRGWSLPTNALEPLALWSEGAAAIGEVQLGSGRLLICGFTADRRDSEWPLHSAFVPFVHRAVSYLLNQSATTPQSTHVVGDSLRLPPEKGKWRAVAGPTVGADSKAEVVTGTVPLTSPGVFEFTSGGKREVYAVNLSPEESDPTPWFDGQPWKNLSSGTAGSVSTVKHGTSLTALSAAETEAHEPLWWWWVAGAALFLLAELGLANRTAR